MPQLLANARHAWDRTATYLKTVLHVFQGILLKQARVTVCLQFLNQVHSLAPLFVKPAIKEFACSASMLIATSLLTVILV